MAMLKSGAIQQTQPTSAAELVALGGRARGRAKNGVVVPGRDP